MAFIMNIFLINNDIKLRIAIDLAFNIPFIMLFVQDMAFHNQKVCQVVCLSFMHGKECMIVIYILQ